MENREDAERMDEETIIIIHKKGDKQASMQQLQEDQQRNPRYKIMPTIIQKKLKSEASQIIGEYQYGLQKGKSTVDAIHNTKQEYKIVLHKLFVNKNKSSDLGEAAGCSM